MKKFLFVLVLLSFILTPGLLYGAPISDTTYIYITVVKNRKVFEHHFNKDPRLNSYKRYWPASAIKLSAAIYFASVMTSLRIEPTRKLVFKHGNKVWYSTPEKLIKASLGRSDNKSHDMILMRIDLNMHNKIFHPTAIHRLYYYPKSYLRTPSWTSKGCPKTHNCTSAKSLNETLRWLFFARFSPLHPRYWIILVTSMLREKEFFLYGMIKELGCNKFIIIGKSGSVPANDFLVNHLVYFPKRQIGIGVTMSTRYKNRLKIRGALKEYLQFVVNKHGICKKNK